MPQCTKSGREEKVHQNHSKYSRIMSWCSGNAPYSSKFGQPTYEKVNEELFLDNSLHIILNNNKLAYRIYVILIANKELIKKIQVSQKPQFLWETWNGVEMLKITGFWTLSIVWNSKLLENATFWKLNLFLSSGEGRETPILLDLATEVRYS
jgi:hypothetical protein